MIPYLFHRPGVKNRNHSTELSCAGASVTLQSAPKTDINMQTERQKFYKHKIKRISTKDDASSVIDESDKSTVTLLGTTSYHEQVNDLSIMNSSNTDQQPETLFDDRVDPNFHAITVNETKKTDENISDLKDRDVIINEVIIEVEREYPEEIDISEVTQIEKTISNDSLQPTITDIIPEKDMDLLRKSLEDDKADDNGPLIPTTDNHPIQKKNKRAVLKTSYDDFLSEDEDFTWDSTSWKETDESSSDKDDDESPRKKNKKVIKDEKVGDAGVKKKRTNKKKESRIKGAQYVKTDGSIAKERNMKPNPCVEKNCPYKCKEITPEKMKMKYLNIFGDFAD